MRGQEADVAQARTLPLTPRPEPPRWLDEAKLSAGASFAQKNAGFLLRVHSTSSLAATFAAKDVVPVLIQTGKLVREFLHRMFRTGTQTNALMRFASHDEFLQKNYPRAVALGQLHLAVADSVRGPLHWSPKERLAMSQQASALVLSTFAWWPIEALLAKKLLDPEREREALSGWFHLWAALGYGMGVQDALLPTDLARARALATLLRQAQYARLSVGERLPEGIPILLGGQVRMLRVTADKLRAAELLAEFIALSPGLTEALGLGEKPVERLTQYAAADGAGPQKTERLGAR